jgi:hypothetical protein
MDRVATGRAEGPAPAASVRPSAPLRWAPLRWALKKTPWLGRLVAKHCSRCQRCFQGSPLIHSLLGHALLPPPTHTHPTHTPLALPQAGKDSYGCFHPVKDIVVAPYHDGIANAAAMTYSTPQGQAWLEGERPILLAFAGRWARLRLPPRHTSGEQAARGRPRPAAACQSSPGWGHLAPRSHWGRRAPPAARQEGRLFILSTTLLTRLPVSHRWLIPRPLPSRPRRHPVRGARVLWGRAAAAVQHVPEQEDPAAQAGEQPHGLAS